MRGDSERPARGGGRRDILAWLDGHAAVILAALCFVYLAAFAVWYPRVMINEDEAQYIGEARLLLRGEFALALEDPRDGSTSAAPAGTYPLGVPALMAPFIAIGGWRGAYLVPALGLLGAVALMAGWLRDARRPVLFAALLLFFLPASVMGRVAMSDTASMAFVTLGLWLFWRGAGEARGRWRWWVAAGVVAGASAVLRPPNVLAFLPLFVGAVLRRDERWWALLVGGVAGLSLRFLSSWLLFGEPFAARTQYPFAPGSIMERLPLFLLGLLVLLPGGLALVAFYRGERRAEIVATVYGTFLFFLLQSFSTVETGFAKRIVLGLRYFLPVAPLIVFCAAEVVPRAWKSLLGSVPPAARPSWVRAAGVLAASGLVATAIESVAVHAYLQDWSGKQARIHEAVNRFSEGVLVINPGTRKFIDRLRLRFEPLLRDEVDASVLSALLARHGRVRVILLDRSDSAWWRQQTQRNAQFLAELGGEPVLLADVRPTETDRVRIWEFARDD